MARELPVLDPNPGHAHAPASAISIAMGGSLAPAADGMRPLRRHPDWIKSRMPSGENYHDLKELLRGLNLNTVCAEAVCPNVGECWDQRTATVMILGDVCTRACGFCAIKTGRPTWFDDDEPRRVAEAVRPLGLEHADPELLRDDLRGWRREPAAASLRRVGTREQPGHLVLLRQAPEHVCAERRRRGDGDPAHRVTSARGGDGGGAAPHGATPGRCGRRSACRRDGRARAGRRARRAPRARARAGCRRGRGPRA